MMNLEQFDSFVSHYGDDPFSRPKDRIPEFLQTVDECPWARSIEKQMALAGVVSALIQLYPIDVAGWRQKHPHVFDLVVRTLHAHNENPDHPGWVALHLSRWYILRSVEDIDQILKLAGRGGAVGHAAQATLEMATAMIPAFAEAVRMLRLGCAPMVTLQ
jgi:hypothetical protein